MPYGTITLKVKFMPILKNTLNSSYRVYMVVFETLRFNLVNTVVANQGPIELLVII